MQQYFDKLSQACETCTTGTCRTYAYSLKYLADHADLDDLPATLEFLKEQPLSRRCGAITALKVWYKNVKKDSEGSDNLAEPLKSVKNEQRKIREK